jgi:hypothetical protein
MRGECQCTSGAHMHLLDDEQLWYYRLPDNRGPPTWNQFVKLVVALFGVNVLDECGGSALPIGAGSSGNGTH